MAAGTGLTQPLFQMLFTHLKRFPEGNHSESPCHAFAHCKGFATAASRRTGILVSVCLWGLPLPWPLPVIGLVSRYLTNCLIGRSLIVKPIASNSATDFSEEGFPHLLTYMVLASVSRRCPLLNGRLTTCYSAVRHYPKKDSRLACFSRTPIAVPSSKINWSYIISSFTKNPDLNWILSKITTFIAHKTSKSFAVSTHIFILFSKRIHALLSLRKNPRRAISQRARRVL